MHAVADVLVCWLSQDVAREYLPGLYVRALKPLHQPLSRRTVLCGDGEAEPGGVRARIQRWQDELVLILLQALVETLEILPTLLAEIVETIELADAYGSLHISGLEVEPDVGVGELVVVAFRQLP